MNKVFDNVAKKYDLMNDVMSGGSIILFDTIGNKFSILNAQINQVYTEFGRTL